MKNFARKIECIEAVIQLDVNNDENDI
jgi:hypothetical protein